MRITTGVRNFSLPGLDDGRVWRGVSRACKLEEKSYSKIANISWAAAKTPMMLFTTHVEKGVWARAYLRGWGRGTVSYSTHPDTMAGWQKFIAAGNVDEVLFKLAFHEIGHVVAYTTREDIGYPPKEWLVQRLQSHYGKPKSKSAMGPIAAETKEIEVALPLDDLRWMQ
jgi:hypothetical protein